MIIPLQKTLQLFHTNRSQPMHKTPQKPKHEQHSTSSSLSSSLKQENPLKQAHDNHNQTTTVSDQLIDSINDFCDLIQAKGYSTIRNTCDVMKKYKIIREFKKQVDQCWKCIEGLMTDMLESDKKMLECYSDVKCRALNCINIVEESEGKYQIKQLKQILTNSAKFDFQGKTVRLMKSQQNRMDQQFRVCKQFKKQMEHYEYLMKDYTLKIIQTIMQGPDQLPEPENQQKQQKQKKQYSKLYFSLRKQIQKQFSQRQEKQGKKNLDKLCMNGLDTIQEQFEKQNAKKKQKTKKKEKKTNIKKDIDKQNVLIQKILDLYKE